MSNQQKVVDFINHWNNRDIEGIMSSLSEDCFYHNIPMDPQNGKEEIRASLEPFVQMATNIEWIIHQIAENEDGVVLTERTERFDHLNEIPVANASGHTCTHIHMYICINVYDRRFLVFLLRKLIRYIFHFAYEFNNAFLEGLLLKKKDFHIQTAIGVLASPRT